MKKTLILPMLGMLLFAAPVSAEQKKLNERELAVCMWEKAPAQARKAMEAASPWDFIAAVAKGSEACGSDSGSVGLEEMQNALRQTEPKNTKD